MAAFPSASSLTSATTIGVFVSTVDDCTTGVDNFYWSPLRARAPVSPAMSFVREVSRAEAAKPPWPEEACGFLRDEIICDREEPRPRWREYVRRR